MKYKLLLLFLFACITTVFSQIVVTVPQYATENDSIIIYFDATQPGAEELLNYTGTVYAHTGVTTNNGTWQHVKGEWGNNNDQPALTWLNTNYYELIIGHPREFYGVTDPSEHISQLDFVFRSSDATKQTRPDIFTPLYIPGITIVLNDPALPAQFEEPMQAPIFAGQNDTINISASAVLIGTQLSSITLFVNGTQVGQTNQDTINYTFFSADHPVGANIIEAIGVDTSGIQDTLSFGIMINPPVVQAPLPSGVNHGINYINNSTVTLALYAPYKSFVYLIGDFNNWAVDTAYQMKEYEVNADSVIWWITVSDLIPGQEYAFQYLVDGKIRIGDPYTEKVLDPANDPDIDPTVYPDLKPYPYGKTAEIVSVLQTDQTPYNWNITNFQRPSKSNLIIYELLVRDFVSTHDYQTLIDTLGYLKRLGVNAIELMPIMEFEGNESWGYNPDFNFAPDKYYGPNYELKRFIDSTHADGIAVILDAPMNDIFNSSPLARLYWDNANNRPAANNPWLNPTPKHPYNVGNDYNYESPAMRYYINRFTKFWLINYHIDGFRFDLAGGYTQCPNGYNNWEQYDPTRIAIQERIADAMWTVSPGAYVILEEFVDNNEENVVVNYGMMPWGNLNCNYNQATMGYASGPCSWDFSGISYLNRGWNHPYLVGYMESHDEERLMYKNLTYGNSSGNYNIQNLSIALQRIKEAATFFLTVPGPKMIWQFGELGYDISIDYPCRTCNKPILWDYYNDPRRYNLYRVFQELIKLKKNYTDFSTGNFSMNVAGQMKRITLYGQHMDVVIVGNFGVTSASMDPNFTRTGKWYDFYSGDSMNVANTHDQISLDAGEFHLYSTMKLPTPVGDILADVKPDNAGQITKYDLEQNFPNPFNPSTQIRYQIAKPGLVTLKIYDILGREVKTLVNDFKNTGRYNVTWDGDNNFGRKVASGIYFYRLVAGSFTVTKKMILMR
jgi:glycosidase